MFKKISQISLLLFFLLGFSVFSQSHIEASSHKTSEKTEQASFSQKAEPELKSYIIPGTVGVVIVLGIASYWLIYRRKHT
ncbi:hypothetical protein E2K98_17310 [Bacillus salipaludis]|uniref:Uncharacterized protein n=1 Tax=Bacillus salipaludis TaxID=2547811 RepID=A0A4R5VNE2_9BACI|nr:hypothetical protein [Bacillus salipaludis]MDQ6595986.1 hypothetical protein [Bacillus salipaludis]TDK59688.1 hypothetical protein E2K98_17310 [Bacillus salipaludis]